MDAGADILELGVPYSDPLADGPVIHEAGTRALAAGATLRGVLGVAEALASRVPVVLMCYANLVLSAGAEEFAGRVAQTGASGLIVPDLPSRRRPRSWKPAISTGWRSCRSSRPPRQTTAWRRSEAARAASSTRSRWSERRASARRWPIASAR